MRDIMSTDTTYRGLTIVKIDYPVMLVESHCAKYPIELRFESSTYFWFSSVSFAVPGFVDCVITKIGHNAIEVVGVEGIPVFRDRSMICVAAMNPPEVLHVAKNAIMAVCLKVNKRIYML